MTPLMLTIDTAALAAQIAALSPPAAAPEPLSAEALAVLAAAASAPAPSLDIDALVAKLAATALPTDTSQLSAQITENTALLRQVLSELRRKKQWRFDLARDQLGRAFQIDATEV